MEVIWASNQSPFFIEALAQWMKFIIIFVPSRNVISRSHVVILLALFHVDYDCTFGIKNVIIFHQTQKTFIWYTKWVLISMWGGPARSSVANSGYLKVEKGGNNKLSNLKDAIFKTLIMFRFISHSQTSQVENTVMEKPKTY